MINCIRIRIVPAVQSNVGTDSACDSITERADLSSKCSVSNHERSNVVSNVETRT
jgi:hypothetical protein